MKTTESPVADALSFLQDQFPNTSLSPLLSAPTFHDSCLHFLQTLLRWNKTIRLTGATDIQELAFRHLADSLFALPTLSSLPPKTRLLDIGSGGGFPAIPLALLRSDLSWCLTESDQRRFAFLHTLKRELRLDHVEVKNVRIAHSSLKENLPPFEIATFRAVHPDELLPALPGYLAPLARVWYWGSSSWLLPSPSPFRISERLPYKLPNGPPFCLFTLVLHEPPLPSEGLDTPPHPTA